MPSKQIALWGLYDFANSVIQVNVLLYLSQWLVVDNGLSELAYGGIFSAATFILLITSPFVGVYVDTLRSKLPILKILTTIIAIAFLTLAYLTAFSPLPQKTTLYAVIGLALIVNVFYQTSLTFFASLIPTLGVRKDFGKISGWGEFFNNAGLVTGILLTLPLVDEKIRLFGGTGRNFALLPAGIAFVLATLPFFAFFKERKRTVDVQLSPGLLKEKTISLLKGLPKFPAMMWFLIGFYFVSDAVRTIFLFFPIYFEKVWGLPDNQKGYLTIGIIIAMMAGAVLFGQLSDRLGTRRVLVTTVLLMAVTLLAILPFGGATPMALLVIGFVSLLWGGYFAISRAMLVKLAPKEQVGEYLGLYMLFERFASMIAPLVWGLVVSVTGFLGPAGSYRAAALSSALIIVVGYFCLRKVKTAIV